MSSTSKRLAKSLGASALAVATIASGPSVGATSATAAEGEQTHAEVTQTYKKFFAKMQPVGLYNEDNGA